jgi:hypothetical protein
MGIAVAKSQEFVWDLVKLSVVEVLFRYTGTYVKLGEAAFFVIAGLVAYKHREHFGFSRRSRADNQQPRNHGRRSTDRADLRSGSGDDHHQEA